MLILSRKRRQEIVIGDDIRLVVTEIRGGQVWIGIEAPPEVRVLRRELLQRAERAEGHELEIA